MAPSAEPAALLSKLLRSPAVTEAVVVSTCHRVEVYAAVEDRRRTAAQHLLEVAAGLDSLVLGAVGPALHALARQALRAVEQATSQDGSAAPQRRW